MQLFIGQPVSASEAFLSEEESWHCVKVLRHKPGDRIHMIDGAGGFYHTLITEANPKKCLLKIESKEFSEPTRKYNLHIAIAPTKNMDRIEWFVPPWYQQHPERGLQPRSCRPVPDPARR